MKAHSLIFIIMLLLFGCINVIAPVERQCADSAGVGPEQQHTHQQQQQQLAETALALVAPGKGLLAADESAGTMGKR